MTTLKEFLDNHTKHRYKFDFVYDGGYVFTCRECYNTRWIDKAEWLKMINDGLRQKDWRVWVSGLRNELIGGARGIVVDGLFIPAHGLGAVRGGLLWGSTNLQQ